MREETLPDAAPSMPERRWRSPALRRLNRPAVDLVNRLCGRRSWGMDWFGLPAQVSVAGVQWIGDSVAWQSHDLLTSVHWRGTAGYLGLSHVAAEAALSDHLGPVLWHELPSAVAIAFLQDGADRLTAANPALGPLRFRAIADGRSLFRDLCAVQLRVTTEDSGEVIDLCWMVEPDAIDLDQFSRPQRGSARNRWRDELLRDWGGLPITLAFELGWVHLPLSELQGLRNEDVLLPDGWWAEHGDGRVDLRVGTISGWGMGYTGVLDEARQRIKVTGRKRMERDLPEGMLSALGSISDRPDAAGLDALAWDRTPVAGTGAGSMEALGDLPVRLTFDLGERSLTLQELATIGDGHVFDLGLSPRHGVSLRVNGLLVGEGEIVEIDGRLGVAVTRILPPRA